MTPIVLTKDNPKRDMAMNAYERNDFPLKRHYLERCCHLNAWMYPCLRYPFKGFCWLLLRPRTKYE